MARDSDIRVGSLVRYQFRSGRNLGFNPFTKNCSDHTINSIRDYSTDTGTVLRVVAGPIEYSEFGGRLTTYWRASTPEQIFFWFPAGDVDVYEY